MITRRTVTVLGTLAVLASVGAALAIVERLSETQRSTVSETAFRGVEAALETVNVIQIRRADDHPDGSVTLARSGDGWIVEERDGYPARAELVRELLFDVTQLQLIESKTSDPGRFDRLHLRDVAQSGSQAARLVLSTTRGETLIDAHFGKTRESMSGGTPMVYLRRTDQEQTYLAEGELDLRGAAPSWLFRGVLDVPREDVLAARVRTPEGEVLELAKARDETDFAIVDLPEGREVRSQFRVNNIGAVLDKLTFEDVRDSEALSFDSGLGEAHYTVAGGLRVSLRFAETPAPGDGGGEGGEPLTWLAISVEVDEDASQAARDLAERIRTETAGWAYKVSDYVLDRFRTSREDLLQPAGES